MKKFIYAAAALLCFAVSSCNCDDPNHSYQAPPKIEVAPSSLAGFITDINGNAIAGATVTLGNTTVSTGADGSYVIENIKGGAQTITAKANGYNSVEATINVPDVNTASYVLNWSRVLNKFVTAEVKTSTSAETEATVETETVPNNDEGKVEITIDVPAAAVETAAGESVDDVVIEITPVYTEEEAKAAARGTSTAETLLTGAALTSNRPDVKIKKPIEVKIKLDSSVANDAKVRKLVNGKWETVAHTYNAQTGHIIVLATEFTSFGVFLPVTTVTNVTSEKLAFDQAVWNNFNGARPITVGDVNYTYYVGTTLLDNAKNNLAGLLVEHVAREYGVKSKKEKGSYAINKEFPVGTALEVFGSQQVTNIVVGVKGTAVRANTYGNVTVYTQTTTRDHNGGGSN